MTDYNLTANTGEPVTEQAPVTLPENSTSTTDASALPDSYLVDGYLATAENGKTYLRPELVGVHAQAIAAALPPLTASAFHASFLRDLKKQLKRGTPMESKMTATLTMLPQSIKLVAKHKAPPVLQKIMTAATSAVADEASFQALVTHLDSVYCYMLQRESGDAL